MDTPAKRIVNFGANVSFQPKFYFEPRTETEVLEILAKHPGRRIRVMGRLHAWSNAAVSEDVLLNLQHLKHVHVEVRNGEPWATVGAGCQMKRLLNELERQGGFTTPSIGLITEQAFAGVISTGTHGSGKHSLSHYIDEIRLATYDPKTGQPTIRTITSGPELLAARCSLGCMGVILSVGFRCRPQYNVEEHVQHYATLHKVLAAETDFPLQQFFLMPWSWRFYGQHRREVAEPRSWFATLYRLYWLLGIDTGLHLIVQTLARFVRAPAACRSFYRYFMPWLVVQRWRTVDRSQAMLVMEHELFRHIETEIFVSRSQLDDALTFLRAVLSYAGGELNAVGVVVREQLASIGALEELKAIASIYVHHYPICVRRVLPDATMISMASGDAEPYYALSIVSYERPSERDGFFRVTRFLTRCMVPLFAARPHWGKYCPINAQEAAAVYPQLETFRELCEQADPQGLFRNAWVDEVLFGRPRKPDKDTH